MTDKMQEEFEKWALTECFDLTAVGGFYSDNETDAAYKAWQACAARMVPEGMMVVSAKWLERHAGPEDHACVRCYPHSDMLVDGFSCYYHKALDVIAAAPEPKQ